MKLIDLLVQELPKRGGWPEGINVIEQNFHGKLFNGSKPYRPFLFDDEKFEIVDEWREARVTREQYEAALAAAQQPVWNGEGLPPVGTECEYRWQNDKWRSGKVCYLSKHTVLMLEVFEGEESESCYGSDDVQFRPIRSEADKKRDAIIDAIHNTIFRVKHDAASIYDAIASGEIPGVKLEV